MVNYQFTFPDFAFALQFSNESFHELESECEILNAHAKDKWKYF